MAALAYLSRIGFARKAKKAAVFLLGAGFLYILGTGIHNLSEKHNENRQVREARRNIEMECSEYNDFIARLRRENKLAENDAIYYKYIPADSGEIGLMKWHPKGEAKVEGVSNTYTEVADGWIFSTYSRVESSARKKQVYAGLEFIANQLTLSDKPDTAVIIKEKSRYHDYCRKPFKFAQITGRVDIGYVVLNKK